MKKLILFLSFFSTIQLASSQASSPEIVVGLKVDAFDITDNNDQELILMLSNRVKNGMAQKGIGANNNAPVRIVARLDRGETFVTATAPSRYVQNYFFELSIENTTGGEIFGSYTEEVKVAKRSQHEAKRAAVLALDLRSNRFQSFLEQSKHKIQSYYTSNCQAIIADGQREYDQRNYLKAINIWQSIPNVSNCATAANEKISLAFKALESFSCNTHIARARAFLANQAYENAMLALISIPNPTSCVEEFELISAELSIRKQLFEQQLWDRFMAVRSLEMNEQRQRQEFLLTLAYLSSRPERYATLQNNTIVVIP